MHLAATLDCEFPNLLAGAAEPARWEEYNRAFAHDSDVCSIDLDTKIVRGHLKPKLFMKARDFVTCVQRRSREAELELLHYSADDDIDDQLNDEMCRSGRAR